MRTEYRSFCKEYMTKRIISKNTLQTNRERSSDNLILIDKPAGWTSFDVVKKVKNIGKFKKVGHAGTLDPFATGLLVLGTGKETKTLQQISGDHKTYIATVRFGRSTDTYDGTGEITASVSGPVKIDIESIAPVIDSFKGTVMQVPPMFSAKKKNGTRLYKLARKGTEIEREAVPVTIFELKILEIRDIEIDLYVKCSKGTYIRSLANDIGNATGYLAYLKELRRVAINDFLLEHALNIQEFESYWKALN